MEEVTRIKGERAKLAQMDKLSMKEQYAMEHHQL
jgi:hypothetical protein